MNVDANASTPFRDERGETAPSPRGTHGKERSDDGLVLRASLSRSPLHRLRSFLPIGWPVLLYGSRKTQRQRPQGPHTERALNRGAPKTISGSIVADLTAEVNEAGACQPRGEFPGGVLSAFPRAKATGAAVTTPPPLTPHSQLTSRRKETHMK